MVDFGLSVDDEVLDEVPLERLEEEISGLASRIAAATAVWLVWVAAYDRRKGWVSWGAKSCAHWLNWQCGMSPRSAREHVVVARKLERFALVRETFLAGELSYSKVRAICRVVEPENEADLIDMAKLTTASQLDRVVAKMPKPDDSGEGKAPLLSDVSFSQNGDGTMTMTVTASVAEMMVVKKAVTTASSSVIDREHVDGESKSDTITRLGGMKAIRSRTACEILSGTADRVRGADATVLVVADIEALNGSDPAAESTIENQRVDSAVVERLCCDAKIQTVVQDAEGSDLATGSEQRIVPRRLRRLLERRDHGMCQFPGCESEHRLHAHHVVHWAKGGPTELWNLILVCGFHHHQVHEGGWNIESTDAGFMFINPAGQRHLVPVLRLPTKTPLPAKNGAAAPLAGLGERANIHDIADIITANTQVRKRRASGQVV